MRAAEGDEMLAVQDDWIQYEEVPVHAPRPVAAVRPRPAAAPASAARMRPSGAPRPAASAVPRPAASAVPARPAPLRLTRRGRIVLVLLPGLLAASAGVAAVSGTPAAEAAPAVARTVVVGSGDSLWSIAQRVAPDRDPRDVVAALRRANDLPDGAVAAGVVLRLPLR